MKRISFSIIGSLFAVLLLGSCKKTSVDNVFSEYDVVNTTASSLIKVNYNIAYKANPAVQLKINGVRVSGTNIQTRYPFPGGGFNTLGGSTGDYLPTAPGNVEVSLTIPKKATNIDSVEIFKGTYDLKVGKRYSLHLADTLNKRSLLVDEDFTLPESNSVKYRFINLIPNAPAVDFYQGSTLVAANVGFMSITDPISLPAVSGSITWAIRLAGSATNISTYASSSTAFDQRVYTVFATGYNGVGSASTEPRRPLVAFYYVR